jgi:hypothetical protein
VGQAALPCVRGRRALIYPHSGDGLEEGGHADRHERGEELAQPLVALPAPAPAPLACLSRGGPGRGEGAASGVQGSKEVAASACQCAEGGGRWARQNLDKAGAIIDGPRVEPSAFTEQEAARRPFVGAESV